MGTSPDRRLCEMEARRHERSPQACVVVAQSPRVILNAKGPSTHALLSSLPTPPPTAVVGVTAAFAKLLIGGEPDCVSEDYYPSGRLIPDITLLLRPLFASDDVAYLNCQFQGNHLAAVPFLMLTYALLAMVVMMNSERHAT